MNSTAGSIRDSDKRKRKLSKKEIERCYFEMFQKDYALPRGSVEYGDKPDVMVRGERTIGIEIANLFLDDGARPESEQVQRRARESVAAKAQSAYERQEGKRIEMTLGFDKESPIRKQNEVAERIARLAARVANNGSGEIRKDAFRDIPELSFAYLNSEEYDDARWQVNEINCPPMISPELLRRAIEEKESKAKSYGPCDAYWLLVVIDFMDPAQDQEIRRRDWNLAPSKVFEKVVVYKTHVGQTLEFDSALR